MHRGLRRGSERTIQREHFLLLHQAPCRFNAFRRAVGIVQRQEVDLAPVDTALLVEHLEIGLADPAQHAVERARAGMRHGLADLDFGIARAGIVLLLGGSNVRCRNRRSGNRSECGGAELAARLMLFH